MFENIKKFLFSFVIVLLIIGTPVLAQTISPTSWDIPNGTFGGGYSKGFIFTNTGAGTLTPICSAGAIGNISIMLHCEPSNLIIGGGSSGSFSGIVLIPNSATTGFYSGNLSFQYGSNVIIVPVTLTIPGTTGQAGNAKLEAVYSFISRTVKRGEILVLQPSFINTGSIDIINLFLNFNYGTLTQSVVTPSINQPSKLSPGEVFGGSNLQYSIATTDLVPGRYTPSLTLVGYANNTRLEAKVDFDIMVLDTSGLPSTSSGNVQIIFPTTTHVNEVFNVNVSNMQLGDTPQVSITPDMGWTLLSSQNVGSSYLANYLFNIPDYYTFNVKVYRSGAQLASQSGTVQVGSEVPSNCTLVVNYQPQNLTDGSRFTIQSVVALETGDDLTQTAKVLYDNVRWALGTSYVLHSGETHTLDVYYMSCPSVHMDIVVPQKEMWVIVPTTPIKVGQGISIKAYDKTTGNLVTNASVYVNGINFSNPTTYFPNVSGVADIRVVSPTYTDGTQTVPVYALMSASVYNATINTNENLTINLNRPPLEGQWQIVDDKGQPVMNGNDQYIVFSSPTQGTYRLYAENSAYPLTTIFVQSVFPEWIYYVVGVAATIFIIVVAIMIAKRYSASRAPGGGKFSFSGGFPRG